MHSVMDIMDNYPECTTQPHSCLQLRPKQLPPPLHPPSSPHDNFLQIFRGVGIFLTLTREGPARSTVGKTHHKCCLSRGKVQRGTEPSWVKSLEHSGFMECLGWQGGVGRSTSWRNEAVQSAEGGLKATTGLTWLGRLAFMSILD